MFYGMYRRGVQDGECAIKGPVFHVPAFVGVCPLLPCSGHSARPNCTCHFYTNQDVLIDANPPEEPLQFHNI